MLLDIETTALLFFGFFIIATLYSSVGFGGGSSYLALLSLFGLSFFFIRSNALICNLLVVSGSTYLFYKNGHFSMKDFLPFIIASIPMAFIGALFKLDEKVFFIILGITLIFSAVFLVYQAMRKGLRKAKEYPQFMSYVLGAGIGLLSGLVGIGGGIFLAPVLNHVLLAAVLLGGQLGVRISLKKASPRAIRFGTAILVLIVGLRILIVKEFY